jgi:hypothetical protein
VGGRSGVEFCGSNRNTWEGVIDLNAALGDTAFFETSGATDNTVRGSLDGYKYSENVNVNTRIQIDDRKADGGPEVRGIQLIARDGSRPGSQPGAIPRPGSIIYDSTAASDSGRVMVLTEDGVWYPIAVVAP